MERINNFIMNILTQILTKFIFLGKKRYGKKYKDKINLFLVTVHSILSWLYRKYKINGKSEIITISRIEKQHIIHGVGNVELPKEVHIDILLHGIIFWTKNDWHLKDDKIKEKTIVKLKNFIKILEGE